MSPVAHARGDTRDAGRVEAWEPATGDHQHSFVRRLALLVGVIAIVVVFSTGELFILPTGLALFGRLAPGALVATTMALWFSASFAGNLLAGGLGSLWTRLGATQFFAMTAAVAALVALLLRAVDGPARRTLAPRTISLP
jgi:dipeptide/tripeptide permease